MEVLLVTALKLSWTGLVKQLMTRDHYLIHVVLLTSVELLYKMKLTRDYSLLTQ